VTSGRRRSFVRSRSGFTLVEALIVVVLLGLITLIGFPRISAAMVRSDLRSARTAVINLVATARAASVQMSRSTWIKFEDSTAYVFTQTGVTLDTIGTVQNLAAQYGVTVAGADSIQFDPRGFGASFGDSTSVVLSRNSHSETVTLDGLGRVIKWAALVRDSRWWRCWSPSRSSASGSWPWPATPAWSPA
jgi:prepilin-type N-terminal cleavage/methylation domain-containing protein